ncbi:hypothetical protein VMCG_02865 [Cytospora schulzeri]|uniref:Uncharacterized protein n=1 Tax=Cytospora schulzeri TaxID=448051 RepID=A0A423WZI7_9PEZI|nr:hypothetical protein VMCG_02865 [Valsa malicola]
MSSHDQQYTTAAADMSRQGSDGAQSRKGTTSQQPSGTSSGSGGSSSNSNSNSQRQQLPSLSSLFPPALRPLHSPLSDRPSHYQATSPLDQPCSAGGYQERSGSFSYFPPTGSSSSCSTISSSNHHQHHHNHHNHQSSRAVYEPQLYDSRTGTTTATAAAAAYPPSHHPRPAFPGPLSPGSQDPDHHQRRPESSSNRWSAHQDYGRSSEYSFGGRDQQGRYPPPPPPLPPSLAGTKHDYDGYASSYRDPRTSSQHQYQQQQQQQHPYSPHHASSISHHQQQQPGPMPGSSSSSSSISISIGGSGNGNGSGSGGESIPTKDGLGPKIWTGTHFLPRFVRAAELPGEGLCYFYDDGSHCKTVIDGEAVNAHWGVTKAGKPRKRLAIACVTCREKKIKCDPDYPRPRGGGHGNTSPTTPTIEHEESPSSHSHMSFEMSRSARHSESVSPRTTEAPTMTLTGPPKRTKYSFDTGFSQGGYSGGGSRDYAHVPVQSPWEQQQGRSVPQLPLPRLYEDMPRPIHALAYSASPGTYILTGSADRTIRLYNPSPSTSIHPANSYITKQQQQQQQRTADSLPEGRLIQSYQAHSHEVLSLAVSADNARFASSGGDRTVFLWDVATAQTVRRFNHHTEGHVGRVNCVAMGGADDSLVVSGGFDTTVRVWDARAGGTGFGRPVQVLDGATDAVSAVAVRGAGIVAGSVDGRVRGYDVRMGRVTVDVIGASVGSLCLTGDGRAVLVGSLDSRVRLMDRESGSCLRAYGGGGGAADDEDSMGWANTDLRVQSVLGGKERYVVAGDEMTGTAAAAADGGHVASEGGRLWAWDLMTGKLAARVRVPWGPPGTERLKKVVGRDGKEKERKYVVSCLAWRESGFGDQFCAGGTSGAVTVFGPA